MTQIPVLYGSSAACCAILPSLSPAITVTLLGYPHNIRYFKYTVLRRMDIPKTTILPLFNVYVGDPHDIHKNIPWILNWYLIDLPIWCGHAQDLKNSKITI
jgi:hypothetical protein